MVAVIGLVVGYYIGGRISKGRSKVPLWAPLVLAIACFAVASLYNYKINEVSSDPSDIVIDGGLFMLFFFLLGLLAKTIAVKLSLYKKTRDWISSWTRSG